MRSKIKLIISIMIMMLMSLTAYAGTWVTYDVQTRQFTVETDAVYSYDESGNSLEYEKASIIAATPTADNTDFPAGGSVEGTDFSWLPELENAYNIEGAPIASAAIDYFDIQFPLNKRFTFVTSPTDASMPYGKYTFKLDYFRGSDVITDFASGYNTKDLRNAGLKKLSTEVKGNMMTAMAEFFSGVNQEYCLIVGVYDDEGDMVRTAMSTQGTGSILSLKIDVTGAATYKMFLWSNDGKCTPISSALFQAIPEEKSDITVEPEVDTPVVEKPVNNEFFVSPSGSDSNDGLTADTAFATIERAQKAVREINSDMTGNIVVNIGGGVYKLDEPLTFNVEDSGTNGYDVVYRGIGSDMPLISGGDYIRDWSLHENGIYKAYAPDFDVMRELYVNGERRYMAQTNIEVTPLEASDGAKAEYDGYAEQGKEVPANDLSYYDPNTEYIYDGFYISKSELPACTNQEDMEFYRAGECVDYLYHVKEIVTDSYRSDVWVIKPEQNRYDYNLIKAEADLAAGQSLGISLQRMVPYGPVWIRNAYELLDEEGEFYFDKNTKYVYYKPFADEDMTNAEVIAPVQDSMFVFRGNKTTDKVTNLRFENLEIAYSTYRSIGLFDDEFSVGQGAVIKGSSGQMVTPAIWMYMANSITFEGCEIHSMGTSAILLNSSVSDINIKGNAFYDIGGSVVEGGYMMTSYSWVYKNLYGSNYPEENSDGSGLMNLINSEDCVISASYYGTSYDDEAINPGTFYPEVWNGAWDGFSTSYPTSFTTLGNYSSKGYDIKASRIPWRSNPYSNEPGWILYDFKTKYSLEDVTLYFRSGHSTQQRNVTEVERSDYEVLLSNDPTFKTYYTVATQNGAPSADIMTYNVGTEEKYRYLLVRKLNSNPFALSCAVARTSDRPNFVMYERLNGINIEDNYMVRTCLDFPTASCVFFAHGDNISIKHNTIKDTPYVGINIGYLWEITEQATFTTDEQGRKVLASGNDNGVGFVVKNNYIENATTQELDGGPIYTLGSFGEGSVMSGNHIKDSNVGIYGYYFDGSTNYLTFYNNVGEDLGPYDSAKLYVPFYNNYATNNYTIGVTNVPVYRDAQIAYPVGQPTGDAYDIIINAGVRDNYDYMQDCIVDGYMNFTDDATAYLRGRQANNIEKYMIIDSVLLSVNNAAEIALTQGKFGSGLGMYPIGKKAAVQAAYDAHKGMTTYRGTEKTPLEAATDLELYRNLVKDLGDSVVRYSLEETFKMCENACDSLTGTALTSMQSAISRARGYQSIGKSDFEVLTILETEYNKAFGLN